jgi:hypothetical protein
VSDYITCNVHTTDGRSQQGEVFLSDIAAHISSDDFAKLLAKMVNGPVSIRGRWPKFVADALLNEHRTLQAMVVQLLFSILRAYQPGPLVDLRNEAAAEACAQLRLQVEAGTVHADIPVI